MARIPFEVLLSHVKYAPAGTGRPPPDQAGQSPAGDPYPGRMSAPARPTLRDGDVELLARPEQGRELDFVVLHAGVVVGRVGLRGVGDRQAELSWSTPRGDHLELGTRAVRLLIRHAFEDLGLMRLEAYVAPDDMSSLRLAARSGLRREGLLRRRQGVDAQPRDHVLLARLVDDPDPRSREGFVAMLNASLPTKRVIAQGLLYDDQARVLLCELTYKPEWDLPGGVVEPGESPARGVVREVREELGVEVEVRGLVTVNWLPQWRGWDDACVFVFDLGVLDATRAGSLRLEPAELVAVHWCEPAAIEDRAADATVTLLRYLTGKRNPAAYLEIGAEPPLP